ncbi:MAG TPA: MBL fold metallo-hydrolase [Aggregatilinea sp.]|uniref:MBL fold metallo-hydrolase n=1 Tax=Aggregatilinea sp. TaxID=2806333 RepID=UPI002B95FF34|nr:MBL fold metallo-hydrolase [Aggregatilinea sp.]HML24085.1 MBL fold metallo-hydrolase [Aggregatilinea sp.]
MHVLAPDVFVETNFRRVTVGAILTGDGFVLIDTPPFPDDAQAWRETLADLSDKPVIAIINTDCHRDRILGNCWFHSRVVVAHEDTIAHAQQLPPNLIDAGAETFSPYPMDRGALTGVRVRLPSVGFTQRMQLRYGQHEISLLSMAGPTTGNLWVHLPDHRILFTGDSILTGQHPYITGACTKNWLDNLTALRRARFPADYIVPGRGEPTTKEATESVSNYLRLARRRVYSLYRLGRPRADTSTLVAELMEMFPFPETESERIQRRIKLGLDRIYEEFRLSEKTNDGAGKP